MGRQSKQYTVEQVLEAIKDSMAIVSTVAESLSCDWATARKYIDMFPEAQEAMENEKQKTLDLAENAIIRSISMDNTQDAKWYLSKKGKDRGYGDEIAVTGKDGAPLIPAFPTQIEITVVPAPAPVYVVNQNATDQA